MTVITKKIVKEYKVNNKGTRLNQKRGERRR